MNRVDILKIIIISTTNQITNKQEHMSFLDYVDLDPHIHLFIIKKQNRQETQDLIKQKIHHLLQTRRFEEILTEAAKLEDLSFPDLKAKIEQAKKTTSQQKKKLGSENVDDTLINLDDLTNQADADYKYIDDQQLKIYKLAKIYYDQGNYQTAYDIIKKLQAQLLNQILYIKTTWAKFYCEIVLQSPKLKKTAQKLKSKIDQYQQKQKADRKKATFIQSTQSIKQSYARRRQFLNLITIAYFLQSKDESFERYVNFCSEQQNSSVLQLLCPYILRYLCVALILNKSLHKNRKYDLFTLVEGIRRKIYKYTDPFVQFLATLHVQFDFDEAKQKIVQIRKCIQDDVLLRPLQEKITQNCQFLYYKVYFKINERASFAQIAQFTGKSQEQAQLWILGFIRSLDIEAKIDSVDRVVVSSKDQESLNEKYIDLIHKMNSYINTLSQSTNPQI